VAGETAVTPSAPITVIIRATEDVSNVANTITVDLGTKYQYVRGFGGMSTPWDNAPDDNPGDFEVMFNPESLGYNIIRVMIPPNSTDIEDTMKRFVANDPELGWSGTYFYETNNLPIRNKDHSYFYDKVRIVNKYGGYVLASPWSPPADWKTNNSINGGGDLKEENYKDFADYLRTYCEVLLKNNAPIYSVSLQNEFTFRTTTYAGCEYSATQHAAWWNTAGNYLQGVTGWGGGRKIDKVQAMSGEAHSGINDLNSVLTGTPGSTVRQYIDILGRHIYGAGITTPQFLAYAQNDPDDPKEVWMTEHNINSNSATANQNDSTWPYVWKVMNDIDLTIRLNHESAFVWWTIKRFYSMIGDQTNGTTEGDVLPRGHGMSHYAKFAKETGRVGVSVTGSATGVNPTTNYDVDNTRPKISAFVTLTDDFYNNKDVVSRFRRWKDLGNIDVSKIKAISLVMFTPTNTAGANGTDMGTVKIELPQGFTIRSASAMRSDSTGAAERKLSQMEEVKVGSDMNSAYIDLPASSIVSVRFTK